MKTKYLFIKSCEPISSDTFFVSVLIGSSRREHGYLRFLSSLKPTSDYFFQKWTADVDEFYHRVARSVQGGNQLVVHDLCLARMSAAELVHLIKSGDYDRYAATFVHVVRALKPTLTTANWVYSMAKFRAAQKPCKSAHVINLKPARHAV